jgi:mono/diheme cytochrome c family protein
MKSLLILPLLVFGTLAVCVVGPAIGTEPPSAAASPTPAPPFDLSDPSRVAAGKKRFNSTCAAYCHGAEGEGGRTPRFKGNKDFAAPPAYKVISEGRRGTDVMPPWGNAFTPEQIWELVAYLKHLSEQPAE